MFSVTKLNYPLLSSIFQAEALTHLDDVTERERLSAEVIERVRTECAALKNELERMRARTKDENERMNGENEELYAKIKQLQHEKGVMKEALDKISVDGACESEALRANINKLQLQLQTGFSSKEQLETEVCEK